MNSISNSEILAGIRCNVSIANLSCNPPQIHAVTWEKVREATDKDVNLSSLRRMIETVFPDDKHDMPVKLMEYWPMKDDLFVVNGVIVKESVLPKTGSESLLTHLEGQCSRVLIPPSLRSEVLQ